MRRNFKIDGIKFAIANRYTGHMEINSLNQKYDLMRFYPNYGWIRVCSCMTLAQGREKAEDLLNYEKEMVS